MSGPRLLDGALLDDFESLLQARGIRTDALAPGLADHEIDEIVGPLELELPEELRAWWRWHNGGPVELLPARAMYSLQHAVAQYAQGIRPDAGYHGDPERALRPVSEKAVILIRCAGSGRIPAPVYSLHDWTSDARLALPSFGELVHTWMGYVEQGIYAARSPDGWSDEQDFPPEVRALGVV